MGRAVRGASRGLSQRLFEPRSTYRLCSAHFEKPMFQRNFHAEFVMAGMMVTKKKKRNGKKLVEGAVPILFAHSSSCSTVAVEESACCSRTSRRRESLYLKRKYAALDGDSAQVTRVSSCHLGCQLLLNFYVELMSSDWCQY